MLGVCLKYETKAFARIMVPLILCFAFSWLFLAVLLDGSIQIIHSGNVLGFLLLITLFPMLLFSLFGIPVIGCIYSIKRYYDNLFSDKAYLMRTLPVKASTLMCCVVVNSLLWIAVTIGMILLLSAVPAAVGADGSLSAMIKGIKDFFTSQLGVAGTLSYLSSLMYFQFTMMLALTIASKSSGPRVLRAFGILMLIFFVSALPETSLMALFSGLKLVSAETGYETFISGYHGAISLGIFLYLYFKLDKHTEVL